MGASDRFSRTIPKDKIGGTANWELRPLAGGTRIAGSAPLSVRGTGAGREQSGYEAGRAQGYADVMRNAQQARAADLQRLESLLTQLQGRFDELAVQGADCLLDLALDIAAQVLRREIQTQRDAILPVVREALALIIDAHAHPTVRLSPQDFELVRDALRADAQYHGCRLLADPSIQPGGCRVESPQAEVDATLATRWRRVVQTLGSNAPPPEITVEGPTTDATHNPGRR
ncbi:putative Flagellar assembly protein FliH/type III secretion system HrpE [Burkholderiales bacterium]|nr:putative Flagellar assembly protein FliH/type III secretion system HrpE [Burkholderiales bacterium]